MKENTRVRQCERVLEARYAYYRRCQTLKKNGEQCRAPAVRGEQICCKHGLQRDMQARWRRQREALRLPERFADRKSVLKALAVVGQALMEDRIDEKLAGRLMWELQGRIGSSGYRGIGSSENPKARRTVRNVGIPGCDLFNTPGLPFVSLSTAELRTMSGKEIEAFVARSVAAAEAAFGAAGSATGLSAEASKQGGTQNNLVRHPSR